MNNEEFEHFPTPQTTKITQTVPCSINSWGVVLTKGDSLTIAGRLHAKGYRVLVLNFANNDSFCDRKFGGKTQEEDLARRSNLYNGLSDDLYPISPYSRGGDFTTIGDPTHKEPIILSQNVTVYKDRNNQMLSKPFTCDIATIAALSIPRIIHNYRKNPDPDQMEFYHTQDYEITRRKVEHICKLASHYDAFVAGAWGLGAFSNPDFAIINLWNEYLKKYHPPRTYFPILDDDSMFKKYLKTGKFMSNT